VKEVMGVEHHTCLFLQRGCVVATIKQGCRLFTVYNFLVKEVMGIEWDEDVDEGSSGQQKGLQLKYVK